MDIDQTKLRFEATKYYSEMRLKILSYLFAAHGAGIAGCISIVKDYASVPQYKGIGLFIMMFAAGMIFAIVAYVGMIFEDSSRMSDVLDGKKEPFGNSKMALLEITGFMFSVMSFIWVLILIARNFLFL